MKNTTVLLSACTILMGLTTPAKPSDSTNLLSYDSVKRVMLILPSDADPVEEYAAAELAAHVKQVTMIEPQIVHATDSEIQRACAGEANLLVLGSVKNNMLLRRLAKVKFFKANSNDQGYTLRTATNIFDKTNRTWLAVLCGKDPRGVLYAVRDFMHFHLYRTNIGPRLEYFRFSHAPTIKVRYLSESGCNLFSAENDDPDFMRKPSRNGYSHNVVFDKQYYLDWLSHCKITHLNMVWCNATAYDRAWNQMVAYARSRGIQVWRHYVPYRPQHEYPPEHISSVPPSSPEGDCPRDRETQTWYLNRLKQMVMQKPLIAGIVIESPYHDSVYCHCEQCRGKENPYSEKLLLEEFVTLARGLRPDLQIIRVTKNPIPNQDTAVRIAEELQDISEKVDFNINTFVDRKHRIRWHDLGYEYGTYLRTYRSALKGKNVEKEVNFLYKDFQSSANRGVIVHGFCYRFYNARFGSFPTQEDRNMIAKYPRTNAPLSLSLVAEAAFEPNASTERRRHKLTRLKKLAIPDYPPKK